jgi:exonuclease SbcD
MDFFCGEFSPDTANIFVGHMMIGGALIGEGSSERKFHTSWNYAVPASCLSETAQYVALGHVHKPQEIAHPSAAFYSGSLLQLDFGEAGQQKSVNIIEAKPRLPAQVRTIDITGGRRLRDVQLKFDSLRDHADRYGDEYLRVVVELERPVISLYDQVREILPNALEVKPLLPQIDTPTISTNGHHTMSPQELFAQYFAQEHDGNPIPEPMLKLFSELYEAEAQRAPE